MKTKMSKKLTALLMALIMVLSLVPASAIQASEDDTVSVYLNMTYDTEFVIAKDDTVMSLVEMDVPYFDLELYGLEGLYYNPDCYSAGGGNDNKEQQTAGTKETAEGVVTILHLFIYATEIYYHGLEPEEAGKGYLANDGGWEGFVVYEPYPGSAFINLWDYAADLNYYLNYEYPLGAPGWGATLDQIALTDGDVVSVRHNANTGNDGHYYHFGGYGESTEVSKTTTQANDVVLTLYQCTENSKEYTTGHERVGEGEKVYVCEMPFDGNYTESTVSYTTNSYGQVTIETSTLEAGSYYVISDTYDPAIMILNVEAAVHTHSYEAVVTEPTCTEEGYTTYTCSCGESYESDFTAATGHNYVNGVCEACGDVQRIIPESARFHDITTNVDGVVLIEEQEPFTGIYADRDLPYYHVILPEGAEYAYINYDQSDILVSQWGYAQAYQRDVETIGISGSSGSNIEPSAELYDDGTADVSIVLDGIISQIPGKGTAILMRNENYEFGEVFTFAYEIPEGYYNVSIPTSERYTVTGETIATDGYTFNVTIAEGYQAGEDFAIKVNDETVATEPGDVTLATVEANVIITVEGVEIVAENDLFLTVDLTNYIEETGNDYLYGYGPDLDVWITAPAAAGEVTTFAYSTTTVENLEIYFEFDISRVVGWEVNGVECPMPAPNEFLEYEVAEDVFVIYYLNNCVGINFGYDTYDYAIPGEFTIKPIFAAADVEPEYALGDVNMDGVIDIADANLAASFYNEETELTEEQQALADVNGDGKVEIDDANLIASYYNENITVFPAEEK